MTFEALLRFVAKQQDLVGEVHTCYEAGAFGYYLHRKLEALGVSNLVVQAQDWDERGKGVKTDRIGALAQCQPLNRYVRGNRKAFSVVRVPTEDTRSASEPPAASAGNWCGNVSVSRPWVAAHWRCTGSTPPGSGRRARHGR